jgi:hypothetical protein
MRITSRKALTLMIAAGAFFSALSLDGDWGAFGPRVSSAEARVGRPLTPMSYAGVARRTTRRAVVGGAAVGAATVGAAAAGAYAVSPGCAQVTDAYGRVYTRC